MDIRPHLFHTPQEENVHSNLTENPKTQPLKNIDDIRRIHDNYFHKLREPENREHSFNQMPKFNSYQARLDELKRNRVGYGFGQNFSGYGQNSSGYGQNSNGFDFFSRRFEQQPVQVKMSMMNDTCTTNLLDTIKKFYKNL